MALPPLFDKLRLPAVGAPQFIIANPGAASRDIRRLIDLVRTKVEERTGIALT